MVATLVKVSEAAIGFMLGWDMISMLVLAVGLAFAIGYAFTTIPMLKTMPLRQAARVTVVVIQQVLLQWKLQRTH